MSLKLSEAIRLGSVLKRRSLGGGAPYEPSACALQLAALAIGREDLAYCAGSTQPRYIKLEEEFNVPKSVIDNVWKMNDATEPSDGKFRFRYTLEEIAAWVEAEERRLGLWDEPASEVPNVEVAVATIA